MTKSTSAPIERSGGAAAAAWSPAGAAYLALLLAGLAVGLWPEAIYVSKSGLPAAPPPALRVVALVQVAYVLLIYPLVLLARARRAAADPDPGAAAILGRRERADAGGRYLLACAVESAVLLLAAVPFYVAAAWFADAVAADVVRTAICVACLFPIAWSAGAWLRSSRRPK